MVAKIVVVSDGDGDTDVGGVVVEFGSCYLGDIATSDSLASSESLRLLI